MNCPKCHHTADRCRSTPLSNGWGTTYMCCGERMTKRASDGILYYDKCNCTLSFNEVLLNVSDQVLQLAKSADELVLMDGELQPRVRLQLTREHVVPRPLTGRII